MDGKEHVKRVDGSLDNRDTRLNSVTIDKQQGAPGAISYVKVVEFHFCYKGTNTCVTGTVSPQFKGYSFHWPLEHLNRAPSDMSLALDR